jgi:methyl-accepting chemotaxis protein
LRVPIGYKFILGFIAVVAVAAFVPGLIEWIGVTEWLRLPMSFLTAMVIGLILGSIFTRSITHRFGVLTEAAQRISRGDLTDGGGLEGGPKLLRDETDDLDEAIRLMSGSLAGLVERIREAVARLAAAEEAFSSVVTRGRQTSQEVVAGTSAIFDGALEQANHLGDASAAVKVMSGLSDEVASRVVESSNASQKVNSMVQRGATAATSAIEKIETIFTGIENTEGAAKRLKEKLNDIPKILDVITHISRQTDLLALNATIEASKAGEHGRGFALVAEEVRRFADNTNKSVEDVSFIVKDLRLEVERVVSSASEGTAYLKGGRDDVRKIREILVEITNYTSEVAEMATHILGLTGRQKEKAGTTATVMEQVAEIARRNLTSTEHVDAAVERHGGVIGETVEAAAKLSELSRELDAEISRFSLGRGGAERGPR